MSRCRFGLFVCFAVLDEARGLPRAGQAFHRRLHHTLSPWYGCSKQVSYDCMKVFLATFAGVYLGVFRLVGILIAFTVTLFSTEL